MPHECTDCGRTFADGSKEMLSGCPDCGGTTFQFRPAGAEPAPDSDEEPPAPEIDGVARTVGNAASAVRQLVSRDANDRPDTAPTPAGDRNHDDIIEADEEVPDTLEAGESTDTLDDAVELVESGRAGGREDAAQSSARRDVARSDELPARSDRPPVPDPRPISIRSDESDESGDEGEATDAGETWGGEDSDDRPQLSELRRELNDQFESIRVLEPGQYELNLMELYDREEYIIALKEDGKYTIQLPERWDD